MQDSDGENLSELLREAELTGGEMQNDGTHEQVIQQDTAGEERQVCFNFVSLGRMWAVAAVITV